MRIGIEAQRLLRRKKHGMDMVALQLIKALPQVAPQNEYVVFVRPGDDEEILSELKNIQLVYVNALTYADWEQVWLPLAILKSNIDLMHFTSNTASVFCPAPYVLTLHDVIFLENTAKSKVWYQRLGAIYRKWIVPAAVRKAAKVVTVSHYEVGQILHHFPEIKSKLTSIYNAASDVFSCDQAKTHSRKFEQLPSRFFLFLGNTDPKKNTANVIQAYIHYRQHLKGELPLVIGDYPRARVENMLTASGETYLLEDIVSLGYLRQSELAELYSKATAFLYPSLRESFGIPLLEAMHSHCPVITSNTSAMPEVAQNAAIIIDPANSEQIAEAMYSLEKDEALRDKLILNGIARAGDFDWEYSAFQYVAIYRALCSFTAENKLSIQNLYK